MQGGLEQKVLFSFSPDHDEFVRKCGDLSFSLGLAPGVNPDEVRNLLRNKGYKIGFSRYSSRSNGLSCRTTPETYERLFRCKLDKKEPEPGITTIIGYFVVEKEKMPDDLHGKANYVGISIMPNNFF